MKLKPGDPDLCHVVRCKQDWALRLRAGATLGNPMRDVRLCDAHYFDWGQEETKRRREAAYDQGSGKRGAHHKEGLWPS